MLDRRPSTRGAEGAAELRLRGIMEDHFDFVWRSLRRLGMLGADADDATQEVFMVAARKLDAIQAGSERRFLFATALRVASTRRRSQRRRREEPHESLEAVLPDTDEAGPEHLAELSLARAELQRILDGMELDRRAAFILYELEELTVPEIAIMLNAPVGTINSRLRAARGEFQAALKRFHARETSRGGVR